MSRTLVTLPSTLPKEQAEALISTILVKNKYAWEEASGGWQKGMGIAAAPSFIAYEVRNGEVLLEGCIKTGWTPNTMNKERALKGFYGWAIKDQVKSLMKWIVQELKKQDPNSAMVQERWQVVPQSVLENTQYSSPAVRQPAAEQNENIAAYSTEQANKQASQANDKRYTSTIVFGWVFFAVLCLAVFVPIPIWLGLISAVFSIMCGSVLKRRNVPSGMVLFILSIVLTVIYVIFAVFVVMLNVMYL